MQIVWGFCLQNERRALAARNKMLGNQFAVLTMKDFDSRLRIYMLMSSNAFNINMPLWKNTHKMSDFSSFSKYTIVHV